MIDTHAHLTDQKIIDQVGDVLARAREAGVERVLIPSIGLIDGKKAIKIARENEDVYAMVGVHPEVLAGETDPIYRDEWLASEGDWARKVEELARSSKKIVGVGEIGLDFYYDKEKVSRELQMRVFQEQLELATKLNLPAVIHLRSAEEEMLQILSQMKELPTGQFHCWSGNSEILGFVLTRGFYVSFCGNITYRGSEKLRETIRQVPLNRLLLETDSPLLSPDGLRGKLNEPANVKIIAEYIANLLGLTPETLINQTTENAQCLFFGG